MEYLPWLLTLLAFLQCCSVGVGQTEFKEDFVGCYHDDPLNRDFLWWQNGQKELDPFQCRKLCEDNEFIYFGFTGPRGSDCYCGNSGLARRGATVAECQLCVRNGYSFKCGTLDNKMAVYKTKASLEVDPRYVGCWTGGAAVFPVQKDVPITGSDFTVTECLKSCQDGIHLFVGIIAENRCICGVKPVSNDITTMPVLSGNCNSYCQAFRENSPCGSSSSAETISIYRIDNYVGCYKANMRDHTYSFWHWPENYAYHTASSCVAHCRGTRFKYAALTSGGEHHCYCGNYGMELIFGGYSGACPDNCNRNGEGFYCAPREAIAVYDTFVYDVPDERYMACYSGDIARLFGAFFNAGNTNVKEECFNRCRENNRPYVARFANSGCYCGNAVFYRNGALQRVAGEAGCNQLPIYWAGCPTRGKYKRDCIDNCNCQNYDICDPYSGRCPDGKCTAGYTKDAIDTSIFKDSCQKLCSLGTFGIECAQKCNCLNGVACTPTNGACPGKKCDPYWTGDTCSDPITCTEYRKYGPGCTSDCNCYANDDCNDQTGICNNNQCKIGMRVDDEKRCTLVCEPNRFGKDCSSRCFCDGEDCNKIDGSCPSRVCKKGYSSNRCDVMNVDDLYVGCYNDDPAERVLFWWPENLVDYNARDCINLCFDQNFKYAGLSKEGTINACFCGNFGFESRGDSSKCTTCTKGTEVFPCAPSDSISIFITYGSGDPDPRFMGCWVAPPQIIGPGSQARFRNPTTASACAEECRINNFKYSSILNGTECFCGSDLQRNSAWKTSNKACNTLCIASTISSASCGGPDAVSVYRAVCTPGSYGTSCQFQCNCEDNKECASSGECPNRRCKAGITYSTSSLRCEIPCTFGQFGVNCAGRCYCKNANEDCSKTTGECVNGCREGFQGLNCSVTQERYLGCFRDDINEPSFFWWKQNDFIQKSADDCIEICFSNGFKYAALTDSNENECSCGNSAIGQYGLSVDCYSCTRGSKTFSCAPRGSLAIYHTFLSPAPPDLRHIGCWTGPSVTEVLDSVPVKIFDNQGDLRVEICCTECAKRGYKYAGLQAMEDCFCGNNLGRSTLRWPSAPSDCNTKCLGDDVSSPPCGGPRNTFNFISVYRAECKIGRWGSQCEKPCNCWEEQRCDNALGTCPLNRCASGWLLSASQTCSEKCGFRKFGLSCEKDCNCAKNTGCNNVTGQCDIGFCDPGYRGTSCSQRCSYEFYGENCTYFCNCGASECNHITGLCGATSESPRSIPSLELLTFSLISLLFKKTLTLLKPSR